MKRRQFVHGATALGALTVAGCNRQKSAATAVAATSDEKINWRMVTTWPKDFPGLGTGANRLAEAITRMSGARLNVKVYGGGELVPPFETFDAVSSGTAQIGHSAAYYWKGKALASQFFGGVPFGMTATEVNGWLYYGGGLELWQELYGQFNIVPFPAGNSGVQMGGWFNREINSVDDLKGLKMRIPGLGGEVLSRVGGLPVNIPGAEIFTALKTGIIDATEWVGPWNDLAFGLYQAAEYYYYPGWHEPGSTLECLINQDAWNALPDDLKAIVETACQAVNMNMNAEFAARNQQALKTLVDEHGVKLREFPTDVISAMRTASDEMLTELAANDPFSARVHDSYKTYLDGVRTWTGHSERSYLNQRDGFNTCI